MNIRNLPKKPKKGGIPDIDKKIVIKIKVKKLNFDKNFRSTIDFIYFVSNKKIKQNKNKNK